MEHKHYELIVAITNYGYGSKFFKSARKYGITGGTITLARGTARSGLLNYLGLGDIRKEIVYMLADRSVAYAALEKLKEEYRLDKANHGIAFTMSVCNAVGCSGLKNDEIYGGEENSMYNLITIIVDKGNAEEVVDCATEAGAKGATIVGARGSGAHEHCKVFAMDIEPEKEIVMILAEEASVEKIVEAINTHMQICEHGNGIVFVQTVNRTYGVYK